jgi:RsiW-degrading membrane proteinase PrsW (M82 family)
MNLAISLTLAIIPALIIVIYFYRKDRAKPEPKGIIIRIFFLGLLPVMIWAILLAKRRISAALAEDASAGRILTDT